MTQELNLVESRRREFEEVLNEIIKTARVEGYTIDVQTIYLEPLRMGGYGQRLTVHLGSELYRSKK